MNSTLSQMAGMDCIINDEYSQKETPMNSALLQCKGQVISNEPDFISKCFKYNSDALVWLSTPFICIEEVIGYPF